MRARWLFLLVAAPAGAQEAEDPVAILVKQAADPDAATRTKAMRGLARAGSERGVEAARAALRDPDPTVRAVAAVALVRLEAPDARVVEALAEALSHPDWYTRWDACFALGSLGPGASAAAPALLAAAGDKETDLGREAAIALARVGSKDPQVLAGIVRLLGSDAEVDRRSLLEALDGAGQVALARDWFAKELVAGRHGLRRRAAKYLGKCGVEGTEELAAALEDRDPDVRAGAIYELRDKIAADAFLASLSDPEPKIRRASIMALRRRKAKDSAPRIATLLSDPDREVRHSAALAIWEFEVMVPEAGPGLVRLLAEGERGLGAASLAAMRSSGFASLAVFLDGKYEADPAGGAPVFRLRLWPRGGDPEHDAALLLLVAALDENRYGPALADALKDSLAPDEDEILVECLGSGETAVRRAAAALLGHIARDREAARRALEKSQADRDPDVRDAAKQAIERLKR